MAQRRVNKAKLLEQAKEYRLAGKGFEGERKWESAGEKYRLAGDIYGKAVKWKEAADSYSCAGNNFMRAGKIRESGESFALAGFFYMEIKDFEESGENYGRAGFFYLEVKEWEKTGECYRHAGDVYNKAAKSEEAGDSFRFAGDAYEKGGKPVDAGDCYRLAGDSYRKAKRWQDAGDSFKLGGAMYDGGGKRQEAGDCYRLAGDSYAMAHKWVETGDCYKETLICQIETAGRLDSEYFNKMDESYRWAAPKEISVWDMLERLELAFRDLKVGLGNKGMYQYVGRLYVEEMRVRRQRFREEWRQRHGLKSLANFWLYSLWEKSCKYGESPARFFGWLLGFIVLWSVLFRVADLLSLKVGWGRCIQLRENYTFFDYIYYSIVTLTTVGYGDIHPLNSLGQAIASCGIILGYGMLGALITLIARKVGR